jgi:hypothetical protein
MRRILTGSAALLLAAFGAGCAPQGTEGAKLAPGEKLQITQEVWDSYQQYLKRGMELGPDRNGAFGVAIIGDVGLAGLSTYTYCPPEYSSCRMRGDNALTSVLDACRREGIECIIFARNDEIRVPYEIVK